MSLTLKAIGLVHIDLAGTQDDFLVLDDMVEVGRIQRDKTHETRWIWTNKVVPNGARDRGDANNRAEAMTAFRSRWDTLTEAQQDSARGWHVRSTPVPLVPISQRRSQE